MSGELLDCLFHLAQVRVGARPVGHVRELAVQADQEAHASRHVLVRHLHSVGVRDLAIGIRQQGEIQVELGDELLMARRRIEAHADDLDLILFQARHPVAKTAGFLRASGGVVFVVLML